MESKKKSDASELIYKIEIDSDIVNKPNGSKGENGGRAKFRNLELKDIYYYTCVILQSRTRTHTHI